MIRPLQGERLLTHLNDDAIVPISRRALAPVFSLCNLPSFQGSALERTAFEAPPRVLLPSCELRRQEPPMHCVPRRSLGTSLTAILRYKEDQASGRGSLKQQASFR